VHQVGHLPREPMVCYAPSSPPHDSIINQVKPMTLYIFILSKFGPFNQEGFYTIRYTCFRHGTKSSSTVNAGHVYIRFGNILMYIYLCTTSSDLRQKFLGYKLSHLYFKIYVFDDGPSLPEHVAGNLNPIFPLLHSV